MTHDLTFTAARRQSLLHFFDPDAQPLDSGVARAVRAALGAAHSALEGIWVSEPYWDYGRVRWVASLEITLRLAAEPTELRVQIPWLTDDLATAHPPAGHRLGDHRGTYLGRPRFPVAMATRALGIYLILQPTKTGTGVFAQLVPEFGPTVRLQLTGRSVVVTGDGMRLPKAERTFGVDDLDRIHALITSIATHFDGELLSRDLERLGAKPRPGGPLEPSDLGVIVGALAECVKLIKSDRLSPAELPAGVFRQMDPEAFDIKHFGDLLSSAVFRGLAAGLAALTGRGNSTDRFAGQNLRDIHQFFGETIENRGVKAIGKLTLERTISTEVDALGRGAGRYASCVLTEKQPNTVARLELSRQLTFIGPGGFPEFQERMDLRVLPGGWQDTLCPVHTPESEKVGLIRHFAWGTDAPTGHISEGVQGYSDLSAASSMVPFVNHNDPTRTSIVSKMFLQALTVDGAEPPIVRTGIEMIVAEAAGLVRSPTDGVVTFAGPGRVAIDDRVVTFGPPSSSAAGQNGDWRVAVQAGDWVDSGDIIAHAPDVSTAETPCLQLGVNALAAFLPWDGWTYEDGIVVSESFADRTSSSHVVKIGLPLPPTGYLDTHIVEVIPAEEVGELIPSNSPLLELIDDRTGSRRLISFPEDARLIPVPDAESDGYRYARVDRDEVVIVLEVVRRTQVGDKFTTRHGGKGVINRILPDEEMPRLPDGSVVEVLLNPFGVLRRLNVGVILEANLGLAQRIENGNNFVVAPRALGASGRRALADRLSELGAPGGRVELALLDGKSVGPAEGAVVGPIYLMKLHHQAKVKSGSRDEAAPSPVTFQPARSTGWGGRRKLSAPQRLGEMEFWALQAIGADLVIEDVFQNRGQGRARKVEKRIGPGLRSVAAHLAVAGIHLVGKAGTETMDLVLDSQIDPDSLTEIGVHWGPLHAPTESPGLEGFHKLSMVRPARVSADKHAIELMKQATSTPERESIRYSIDLAIPVQHPWSSTDSQSSLEPLAALAVLPAQCFPRAERTTSTRDSLRARYLDIISCNIQLQESLDWLNTLLGGENVGAEDVEAENGEAEKVEAEEPAAPERPQSTQIRSAQTDVRNRHQALVRSVHALLGQVTDQPADNTIAGRLSSKYGLLWRNLLGTAAVRSGRAVLTGDPTRPVESVGLPRWMMVDLGITTASATEQEDLYHDVVLINRQPTLHPYSLIALRVTESVDETVQLPPYLLKALAGDFDGDTVAVHRPVSSDSRQQWWELARPAAWLRNSNSGGPLAKLDLDIGFGLSVRWSRGDGAAQIRAISRAGRPENPATTKPLGAQGSVAQLDQDPALAGDLDIEAEAISIIESVPGPQAIDRLSQLMRIGFAEANGWGFSLIDLPPIGDAVGFASDTDDPEAKIVGVLKAAAAQEESPWHRIGQAFVGKAGGKPADQAQLLVSRGASPTSNPLIPSPRIGESFLDGLPTQHYFGTAQQSVAALAAKKLVTPLAGGLTRSLVELGYEALIGQTDCGATGTDRSPLACLDTRICQTCYGPDPGSGDLMEPGRRVGILAAMLIGEQSTQLAMKSIHQRGKDSGLSSSISELRGVFGSGRFSFTLSSEDSVVGNEERAVFAHLDHSSSGSTHRSYLSDFFRLIVDARDAPTVLAPVLRRFGQLIGSQVNEVHAQVLLAEMFRQFAVLRALDPEWIAGKSVRSILARSRPPFSAAAWHGDLMPLIGAASSRVVSTSPVIATPALTRLLAGGSQ